MLVAQKTGKTIAKQGCAITWLQIFTYAKGHEVWSCASSSDMYNPKNIVQDGSGKVLSTNILNTLVFLPGSMNSYQI